MRARHEIQPRGGHLGEQVSLEVDVVGVGHADAGWWPTHGLLLLAGRGQVVLARLRIEEAVLARAHERRMREGQPLEP